MKNNLTVKLFCLIPSILLFSCSQGTSNIDVDLSDLPKFKKAKVNTDEEKELTNPEDKAFITDLIPLKDKEQVLSKFNFGKKDPFSKQEANTKLNTDLKLTGFLATETIKYVFVSYQGNEGTITEDSIGGINTNLLPNGAKVMNIDIKNKILTINFENEDLTFIL